ncbi:hypothetical protein ALQ83_200200 [Pseudomonas syringae pv. berberidis]|nr:hypothetical protein ALQ83_200200 [Pseudomonas syringae pv. berberidis]
MLAKNQLGDAFVLGVGVVNLIPIHEENQVSILLERARVT